MPARCPWTRSRARSPSSRTPPSGAAAAPDAAPPDSTSSRSRPSPRTRPAAPSRPGRRKRLAALAAVLVGTLALGVLAGLLFVRSRDAATVASYYRPASAPMTAARDAGRLLFSYDHRTIDADFAAAKALTTGTFAEEYEKTTTSVVRPVAIENKAVVEATAVVAGDRDGGAGPRRRARVRQPGDHQHGREGREDRRRAGCG